MARQSMKVTEVMCRCGTCGGQAFPFWRPIETAPRDGKRVLVWDPAVGEGHMVAWHDSGPCCWLCAGHIIHPTHWMPLPEGP